jgi:hypothetical protein
MLLYRRALQVISLCALLVAVLASPAALRAAAGANAQRLANRLPPLMPRTLYKADSTGTVVFFDF